jgi:imidazole glycerol phosphate synthase glutamine amidotransferase subunit
VITIFDYGAGNLQSVQNTLGAIGAEFEVVRDAESLSRATKIILPGVGHFGQMMRALDALRVRETLVARIREGVPFLGICLGLQALFECSEEAPDCTGLALFPGTVRRFATNVRCPHMGWDNLDVKPEARLFTNVAPSPYLYFAHSYYSPVIDSTAATCTYTVPYTAALECGSVFGVQFHPEKSGPLGLRIVQNFVEL